MKQKKSIAIIGGGASALMLACSLDNNLYNICIYEKNAALGRKFLVAGKGGFNLTHSEDKEQFSERYYPKEFMTPFLDHFSQPDFRIWLKSIGIETYIGTSKRVFPVKGIKPIEVLKAIEKALKKNKVSVFYDHEWRGWHENDLMFYDGKETKTISPDITVFALGGTSWKVTGSNGSWRSFFKEKGVQTPAFYPSNCAYKIEWDEELMKHISGQALKNCTFSCGYRHKKGEVVLTEFGIEGSGIYALSKEIREQLIHKKRAEVRIDFKPELSITEIQSRLENRGRLSIKDALEKEVHLSAVQIHLLKYQTTKEEYHHPAMMSRLIKEFPVELTDFAPIDDAISTVGGISINEVNNKLELKKLPNHYCIGEMLDWDAPTGGYLLQACFSMGKFLADTLNSTVE
ncbi:MAG: TIGR03862 family flavoprotein [Bacteroidetes bacterium]|nr:TIGR03862 family flavoprotein [Bacteroidota bacterium]